MVGAGERATAERRSRFSPPTGTRGLERVIPDEAGLFGDPERAAMLSCVVTLIAAQYTPDRVFAEVSTGDRGNVVSLPCGPSVRFWAVAKLPNAGRHVTERSRMRRCP